MFLSFKVPSVSASIDQYYIRSLEELAKNSDSVPKDSMEVTMHGGKVCVLCKVCSSAVTMKYVTAGSKEKALTNVKAHIQRKTHQDNVTRYVEKKHTSVSATAGTAVTQSGKDEAQEQGDCVEVAMARVELECPGVYCLVYTKGRAKSTARVRCQECNQVLNLFPARGSAAENVKSHAAAHSKPANTTAKKTCKQGSMDAFVTVGKRLHPVTEQNDS